MSLSEQLMEEMKAAMKGGDKVVLETIRGIRAQIKNVEIEKQKTLDDEEILKVLGSAAKKRREAIEQFEAVGRQDRADEEKAELKVIEKYLPEQMGEAAVTQIVKDVIAKVGASSPKDIGKVMGAIMPLVKGKADGKLVQEIVRNQLNSM